MLDALAIIAEAEVGAGFCDIEPHLHRNLEALVASLNGDGKLNKSGEAAARRGLVARNTDRIAGQKWVADYPEIADEVIEAPLFLCGLPRSGTTYFQYLFDHDRRFRLIRTWQSLMPLPPPGFDPGSVIERKAMEEDRRAMLRPKLIENFVVGLICLSVFSGAYVTEIVRAGLQSVPRAQIEAGNSLGLSQVDVLRYVVFPQAIRNVLPPLSGQFIQLIKDSSLVSLVSIQELSFMAQDVQVATQRVFEIFLFVAALYFVICFGLSQVFQRLEHRAATANR